ncbi:hypothetical protein PTKIN_Ptkin16aG0026500 [Pterospermum kingtungense]
MMEDRLQGLTLPTGEEDELVLRPDEVLSEVRCVAESSYYGALVLGRERWLRANGGAEGGGAGSDRTLVVSNSGKVNLGTVMKVGYENMQLRNAYNMSFVVPTILKVIGSKDNVLLSVGQSPSAYVEKVGLVLND